MDLSVIIPTYNNSQTLKVTLESLLKQRECERFDFEIIVVDNNSSDDTKLQVDILMEKFSGKLIYRFEPRQGNAYARNNGIKHSRGKWICFTDDDCVADPHWLLHIYSAFCDIQADVVQGKIVLATMIPPGLPYNLDFLKQRFAGVDYGEPGFISGKDLVGANAHFRRSIFDKFGGYSVHPAFSINQDTEFSRRLARAGVKFYYTPKAVIHHHFDENRITEAYLQKQSFMWGRSDVFLDESFSSPLRHVIFCLVLWMKYVLNFFKLRVLNRKQEASLLKLKICA
ncbi:MAG: glycosyltransferase, partial [Candidatus Moranbacteria bacterium]|nr:glycosyltransferase [Candidatus Moranbacteria bacterium]